MGDAMPRIRTIIAALVALIALVPLAFVLHPNAAGAEKRVSSVSVCGADLSDRARADPIARRRGRHGLVALKVLVTRRPWSLTVLTVFS